MYRSVELDVGGKLLRGVVRAPKAEGRFPTVIFYHGFTVDKVGMMRLHELFARQCVENGFACVRFDFYGCGESDGDFREMRLSHEIEQAKAIYRWTLEQDFCDPKNTFVTGHSMGGLITGVVAASEQPKAAVMWAPAPMVYYDATGRAGAVPTQYKEYYDIGGLALHKEFLVDARRLNAIELSKGYEGNMLLIHGSEDEKASVAAVGLYEDIYDPAKFEVHIVEGSNHQFSSLAWKQEVYDKSIEFLKNQIG